MVLLRQCCCGVSLRKGTLAICYWTLGQELLNLILLLTAKSLPLRNESDTTRYFAIWPVLFNLLAVITALYGVQKERAPLLIPYLAYRIVCLISSIYQYMFLFGVREIANSVNETLENSVHNERDQTFDTLPLVVAMIAASMAVDLYFLLVVYSYYQSLIAHATVVAVALPIVSYSVPSGPDNLDNIYSQPPVNPYLFDAKTSPFQQQEACPPPPGYHYYGVSYHQGHPSVAPLPPPYRP